MGRAAFASAFLRFVGRFFTGSENECPSGKNHMLHSFFYPYFLLLYGASWNVRQSLEGMGVRSPSPAGYDGGAYVMVSQITPGMALGPIIGLLLVLVVLVSESVVLAGYVLARKTGSALAILLLCL